MGLSFDLLKALYERLCEDCEEICDNLPVITTEKLPEDFRPEILIEDKTSTINILMNGEAKGLGSPRQPKGMELRKEDIIRHSQGRVDYLSRDRAYDSLEELILSIDSPAAVPASKSATHTSRRDVPFLDNELLLAGVYQHSPLVKGDVCLSEDFLTKEAIEGVPLNRLWSTAPIKPLVGTYYMNSMVEGLRRSPIDRKWTITAEGCWPSQGECVFSLGELKKKPGSAPTFRLLEHPLPGEFDVKFLHYLEKARGKNGKRGKRVVICSPDGDIQMIVLLYYMKLLLADVPLEEFPVVMIDRTNGGNISRYQFIDMFTLFTVITIVACESVTCRPNRDKAKIAKFIVSCVTLALLKGSDFNVPYGNWFEGHEPKPIETNNQLLKKPNTDQWVLLTDPSELTHDEYTARVDTMPIKPPKSKPAIRHASEKNLTELVYSDPSWKNLFEVSYDSNTKLVEVKLDYGSFKSVLQELLDIPIKKHSLNKELARTNFAHIQWILTYWLNEVQEFRNSNLSYFDTISRRRFHCIQLKYGWKLAPNKDVNPNSTILFEIPLEADDLRTAIFGINGKRAYEKVISFIVQERV